MRPHGNVHSLYKARSAFLASEQSCGVQMLSAVPLCAAVPGWWRLILLPACFGLTWLAAPVNPYSHIYLPAFLYILTSLLRFAPWWLSIAAILGLIAFVWVFGVDDEESVAQGGWGDYVPLEQCAPRGASDCVAQILNATNHFEVRLVTRCSAR